MNHMFRKAAVAAAVATASFAASSATIVDQWAFTIDAFWTGASFDTSGNRAGVSGYDTDTVSWTDTLGNTSSLAIEGNPATGTVTTNSGVPGAGQTLVHTNHVVYNAKTLRTADLTANLTLKALDGTDSTVNLDPLSLSIRFKETPNNGNCGFTSVSNCDDIFVLATPPESLQNSFTYNGVQYSTQIVPVGRLLTLSDTACALAGAASGCIGFTTPENQATPMSFGFLVNATVPAVPEPGTYALMGLGLLGVVAMRRRNAKRD